MDIFKNPSLYWLTLRALIYGAIFAGIWYGGNFFAARELLIQLQSTSPLVLFVDQSILDNTYYADLQSTLFDKSTNILLRTYEQNLLSPQTGSFTFPYTTISDAVGAAKNQNIHTIIVTSGTYTEKIVLPDDTVLYGQGDVTITIEPLPLQNVIQTGNRSTLLNLHISGGDNAIMIPHDTSVNIIDVTASDASDFGILMGKKDRISLINELQVEQPIYDIINMTDEQINAMPLVRLHRVTIKKNKNQGMYLRDGRITIEDCLVTENGEEGIDLHPHMNATITNTTSSLNGESGLETEIYDNIVKISQCVFDQNIKSGIALLTAIGIGSIEITDSIITNNQQYGMRCAQHAKPPKRPRPFFSSITTETAVTYGNNAVAKKSSDCYSF